MNVKRKLMGAVAGLAVMTSAQAALALDEITELTTAQKIFAAAMLVLFFLVFTPVPLSVVGG